MREEWSREGINYWENSDCPREYLEKSLIELVEHVEGVEVTSSELEKFDEEELRHEVGFYEYVADK